MLVLAILLLPLAIPHLAGNTVQIGIEMALLARKNNSASSGNDLILPHPHRTNFEAEQPYILVIGNVIIEFCQMRMRMRRHTEGMEIVSASS